MPKAYEAAKYEDAIYDTWDKSGFFNPDNLTGEPYAVMMPPPNVTGVLHLGHALENSIMDTMIRFQRMRGKKTLLVPGTDHAALPTQAKVEKMLIQQGMKNPRLELGREGLVEKIREFADQSRSTILNQIKKMGTSCDWSRLAYTFDEKRSAAVNELFSRMYKDGLIYRGYRVVNWSVKGQSTCSDDELVYVERATKLYTMKYSKDFPITIATTRPETKLGDTAVAVHPEDERYKKFIGQTFVVDVGSAKPPSIKIISNDEVDPTFGTGAVGVTPAHSMVDFAMYETQKAKGDPIDIIPVIGGDGLMTPEAGEYAGMSVEDARAKFVAWLGSRGLLEKEEDLVQSVGTSDRFGDVVESIPMTQWWLDVNKSISGRGKSLKDLMREAVTTGLNGVEDKKVTITPDRFTKSYLDRVEHLRDWCLSRQIWWGHRIPVWYKGSEMVVGSQPEGEGWTQDEDTLDTWFSSGSWTFSTLGWPEQTKDLETFHPTSWMQMGYEILYLWLMRMVLMSAYALDQIPFKDVYIHGMVCDENGKKFSKSSGNGIDPIEVIEKYGCDALRMSLLLGVSPGNDTKFFLEKIQSGRNFTNKLWNISRFILSSVDTSSLLPSSPLSPQTLADRWILSRFQSLQREVTDHLEAFEFSQAGEKLRDFTWGEFADWYLEIAKIQNTKSKIQTSAILLYVLERILVLWHPFMPFVTEEIWKQFSVPPLPEGGPGGVGVASPLMIHPWPVPSLNHLDRNAEEIFSSVQEIVVAIRNIRSQYKVSPKTRVSVMVVGEVVEEQIEVIKSLAGVGEMAVVQNAPRGDDYASTVAGGRQVFVSLVGLVDKQKESAKLEAEKEDLEKYIQSLALKLADEEFSAKAPANVIASMKQKQDEAKAKLQAIESQMKV